MSQTYAIEIDRLVKQAASDGKECGAVVMPLLNMAASVIANVVAENNLNPADELAMYARQFDELFHEYLEAYVKQGVSVS